MDSRHIREFKPFLSRQLPVLTVWLIVISFCLKYREYFTLEGILGYTPENPLLCAILMITLFAVKSLTFFIYSGILYAVSGVLFRLPTAILINLLGTAVMVTLPYWLGRKGGSASLERLEAKHPGIARVTQWRKNNDFFFAYILRVAGCLPADVASLYLGAVKLDFKSYLWASVLGYLPTAIAFSVMGANLNDTGTPVFLAAAGVQILVFLISVSGFLFHNIRKVREPDSTVAEEKNCEEG